MNKDPKNKFWDFSTLHVEHPLYDASSKNELGLFKLETSDFIAGLVGARPKVYSVETIPYEDFAKLIKKSLMINISSARNLQIDCSAIWKSLISQPYLYSLGENYGYLEFLG